MLVIFSGLSTIWVNWFAHLPFLRVRFLVRGTAQAGSPLYHAATVGSFVSDPAADTCEPGAESTRHWLRYRSGHVCERSVNCFLAGERNAPVRHNVRSRLPPVPQLTSLKIAPNGGSVRADLSRCRSLLVTATAGTQSPCRA